MVLALALHALVELGVALAVRPWGASAPCAIRVLAHHAALALLLRGAALALCTPLLAATAMAYVRFCRYRFPATDLNSKATWFGIQ